MKCIWLFAANYTLSWSSAESRLFRRLSGEKLMTSLLLAYVVVFLRETVPCLKLTPWVAYFCNSRAIDVPVASRLVLDFEPPAPGLKSLMRLPPRFKLPPPRMGENSLLRLLLPAGSLPRVLARNSEALEMAYYAAISASSMNLPFLSVFKYLRLFLAHVSGL